MKLFELFGEIKIDGDKANKQLSTIDDKAGKVGGSFKKMAGVIAGAVSVAAIAGLSKKVIGLGAEAEEMYNKYNVVFDGMADDVTKWADSFAKSRGRSTVETQGMLGDLADLQQGFGLTQEESFNLSTKIVDLGTDLASFNNVNDATAVEAVSKAMMGEAEMAKQLGLALNVEEVKKYAESQGMVYEEMSKAEKMTATYELAVQQSQNAIGDAERSSGSFTNQMKALRAGVKDAATGIGIAFMPMMGKVVTIINEKVVPAFVGFADWIVAHMPEIEAFSKKAFDTIATVTTEAWRIFTEYLLPVFKAIFDWVSVNWPTISAIIKGAFETIQFVWNNVLAPVLGFLWDALKLVVDFVANNFPGFQRTVESVMDGVKTAVGFVVDVFQALADGIDWALDKWNEWRNRPEDKQAGGGFSGGASAYATKPMIDGRHADGLDYVPKNGYIAELHKGERVLTAEENKNPLGVSITGNTFNIREEADIRKVAQELFEMQRVKNRGRGIATT